MPKVPRITGREVVRALEKAGFTHIRTRGSHFYLYHYGRDRLVTVPVHSGKTLAPKTLKSILKQASLDIGELKEFL